MIPNRIGIENRSIEASLRKESGHFEGDTVVSRKGGSGGISVLLERKTRLVRAKKIRTMSPKENLNAILSMKEELVMKTLTFDNGIENKRHKYLGIPTFFCNPYSSWEKGSVENVNKMIRRYFPKGTNFASVSEQRIEKVVKMINEKPRKILGYRSALEAATEEGVLLRSKSS